MSVLMSQLADPSIQKPPLSHLQIFALAYYDLQR
jgi:hypothetical protein